MLRVIHPRIGGVLLLLAVRLGLGSVGIRLLHVPADSLGCR